MGSGGNFRHKGQETYAQRSYLEATRDGDDVAATTIRAGNTPASQPERFILILDRIVHCHRLYRIWLLSSDGRL